MSGNDEKESGNSLPETSKSVDKPPECDSASKKYPELYENDEVVKRQMEMISESLAACKRMSKRRSPKKEVDADVKPEVQPDESGGQDHGHPDSGHDHSPDHVSNLSKEKTEEIPEEKQESLSNGSSDSGRFTSLPEVSERKENSHIGMYKPEEVDPMKMMEVIQRELKSLLEMTPVVSPTVNELFDAVLHYQRTIDDLKRKCAVKNRMIVTLLKGLRTDVPNEWWEELVDYVFTDAKPNEVFEPGRMTEFLRQTSAYLLNKEPSAVMQDEKNPSEEEGLRKWIPKPEVEWNVLFEDLLSTAARDVSTPSEANVFSPNIRAPMNFFTFPASIEFESKPEVMIKKLENQVLVLSAENDRLWNEINDLRALLKTSVEESNEVENMSNRPSRGLSEVIKTSGKTINLTIQIGDKDGRRSSRGKVKSPIVEEWCLERGKSKSSPVVKCVSRECDIFPEVTPRPNMSEHERKLQQKLLTDARYQLRSKSNRNHSDVDLTSLDDTSPTVPDYVRKEGNERLREFLRDKMETVQHVLVGTPRPSQHDLTTNVSEAGPSNENGNRRANLTNLFLKPSMIQLVEKHSQYLASPSPTITNERELQTIPENDSTFSTTTDSAQSVDQALQILRVKLKSIYKDVSVLKSKNDRMDKLLDKLLGEAFENCQKFKEMGNQVNGLRERHS